jgi:hypothetical protein
MSQFLDRSGAGSDCIDNEMSPVVNFFADKRLVISGYITLRWGF